MVAGGSVVGPSGSSAVTYARLGPRRLLGPFSFGPLLLNGIFVVPSYLKIQMFTNNCLRRILNVSWKDKITKQQLWSKAGCEQMDLTVMRRKWKLDWAHSEEVR